MLSIVTWKWSKPGYRSKFTAERVNAVRRMVAKYYPDPHRFICITDDAAGLDPEIEAIPLWDEWADILNPTWGESGPSCYRRLRSFAPDFEQIAGKRFVCIDLDLVITGDLRPVWNRPEDFVIYRAGTAPQVYNGSMYLMTAGSRRQVWDQFDPVKSPGLTSAAKLRGTDQAWIQYVLGPNEAQWTEADGVYGYRSDCLKARGGALPPGARVVMFWGYPDPWSRVAHRAAPWIGEHADFGKLDGKGLLCELALKHAGRPIVVMGGGESLPEHLARCPKDAVYISANQHGAMLRKVDYILALDSIEDIVRPFDVPIIGKRPWCDIRIENWKNIGNSGMEAARAAWVLGGHPIILAGMDCYTAGTYHHNPGAELKGTAMNPLQDHLRHWQGIRDLLPGATIRTCGGPTTAIFPEWDPAEILPAWSPPAELVAMRTTRPHWVKTKRLAYLNGIKYPLNEEVLVSPEEFAGLMHRRRVIDLQPERNDVQL